MEFGEGHWSWPPKAHSPVYPSRVKDMESVLVDLAINGSVTDKSGGAGLVVYERVGYTKSTGAWNALLADLAIIGLVDRKVKGKKTVYLGLGVPFEELPLPILAQVPRVMETPDPEPVTQDIGEPEVSSGDEMSSLEMAWAIINEPDPEPLPALQSSELSVAERPQWITELGSFLLDEVIRRATEEDFSAAPVAAERNHLAERLKRSEKHRENAEQAVLEATNRLKGARAEIAAQNDQIRRLEANLQSAIGAARSWANGDAEETRKKLEVLMKQVPGFSREG